MNGLFHVALASWPGGGTAYIGMKHVSEYREDVTGYEILNTDTLAACDVCGEPLATCSTD